ncbi:MAG: flagellar hook-length control protein FliK [Roseovarius sp.]
MLGLVTQKLAIGAARASEMPSVTAPPRPDAATPSFMSFLSAGATGSDADGADVKAPPITSEPVEIGGDDGVEMDAAGAHEPEVEAVEDALAEVTTPTDIEAYETLARLSEGSAAPREYSDHSLGQDFSVARGDTEGPAADARIAPEELAVERVKKVPSQPTDLIGDPVSEHGQSKAGRPGDRTDNLRARTVERGAEVTSKALSMTQPLPAQPRGNQIEDSIRGALSRSAPAPGSSIHPDGPSVQLGGALLSKENTPSSLTRSAVPEVMAARIEGAQITPAQQAEAAKTGQGMTAAQPVETGLPVGASDALGAAVDRAPTIDTAAPRSPVTAQGMLSSAPTSQVEAASAVALSIAPQVWRTGSAQAISKAQYSSTADGLRLGRSPMALSGGLELTAGAWTPATQALNIAATGEGLTGGFPADGAFFADGRAQGSSGAELRGAALGAESSPQIVRHVAAQIAEAMSRNAERAIDVILNPAELGRVRITLSQGDAGLLVTVAAERAETLDLMRRNSDLLGQEFQDLGYGGTSFSFSHDQQAGEEPRPAALELGAAEVSAALDPSILDDAPLTPILLDRLDIRL